MTTIAVGSAMPLQVMVKLCPQCGVVAPERGQRCAVCSLAFGSNTLERPDPPVGLVWASLWCWARCPSCREDIPIDRFDDERATCPSCGAQCGLLEVRRAFDHAHVVGDLAGPDPEGRFADARVSIAGENPFRSIGVLTATSEDRHEEVETENGIVYAAVSVRVAPGHPLCEDCHNPLDVTLAAPGVLAASCAGCALRFNSSVPAHFVASMGALRGVIAIPYRDDRPAAAVVVGDDGDARGMLCPDCTAPLPPATDRRVVRCPACRTVSVVPRELWRVSSRDALALYRAWALFEGPSPLRSEVTRNARKRPRSSPRPSPMPGSEPPPSAPPPTPPPKTPPPKTPPPPASDKPPRDAGAEARARARASDVQHDFRESFVVINTAKRARVRRRLLLGALAVAAMIAITVAVFVVK